MILINTFDTKFFTLDGVKFPRIYQPLKQGSEAIGLYSIYDTRQQLVNSTKYDEFQIDGATYDSQSEVVAALLDIVYSGASEYNVEQLTNRVDNLEENQVTGVQVYSNYADLPTTGTLLVSYKVSNDSTDSDLNGYYHWTGSTYVKDYDLIDGTQYSTEKIAFQRAMIDRHNYISADGTEITESVVGIYSFGQTMDESPSYTGGSYKTFTYTFVAGTPSNYAPQTIYVKGVSGANNGYRSIFIEDENGYVVFKTNRSGDFSFQLYHNWRCQVTTVSTGQFFYSPSQANLNSKVRDNATRLDAVEGEVDDHEARIDDLETDTVPQLDATNFPVSDFMELTSGLEAFKRTSPASWQSPTITDGIEEDFNGVNISGKQMIFPNPWTVTTNGNIFGFSLPVSINSLTGDRGKIFFAIHSDTEIPEFGLYIDGSATASIIATNAKTMKIGWNFYFAEFEFLQDDPSVCYLVARKTDGNNNDLQGATLLFVTSYKTNDTDYKLTDYLYSLLLGRIEALEANQSELFRLQSLDAAIVSQMITDEAYLYGTYPYFEQWQTDTVSSSETYERNGVSIQGTQYIFGTLTPEDGGANNNVFGIKISRYSGDSRLEGDIYNIVVPVWSDRDMDSLTPSIYFSNGNGELLETNFTFLKKGWNVKYWKVKVTADAIAGESHYVLFSRAYSDNKANIAGSTIFLTDWLASLDDFRFLDYNFIELMKRVTLAEQQIVLAELNSNIVAFGDSLTAGAGADKTRNKAAVISTLQSLGIDTTNLEANSPTYPYTMGEIIGTENVTVINMGVGGEKLQTIAARQGAAPAKLPYEITISQTAGTKVEVADDDTNILTSMFDGSEVAPLLQGSVGVNPCMVEGVECTLSAYDDSGIIRYELTRTENGTRDVTIPAGTPLIMYGSKAYRKPKAAIIWCWQNGGYTDDADLIEKLEKIVENIGTDYFVIVGLHTRTQATGATQEGLLEARFGNRFFNWRRYISTNALYDFGITPTTDADFTADQLANGVKSDEYQMSIGTFPSSLWRIVYGEDGETANDMTHLNAAGYMILGYKLVERLRAIGLNL